MRKYMNMGMKILTLSLVLIVSVFSMLKIYAENNSNLKFTTSITDSFEGGLAVDLYTIAEITPNGGKYTYNAKADFESLFSEDIDFTTMESSDLKYFASKLAGVIFSNNSTITPDSVSPFIVNGDSKVIPSGKMFLAMVRSNKAGMTKDDYIKTVDIEDKQYYRSFANSDDYEYIFEPILFFVTGDKATEDTLSIDIKYEKNSLLGELIIEKELLTYAGRPVTFVYLIQEEKSDGTLRDIDVASITYNNGDFSGTLNPNQFIKSVTVGNLKVGTNILVTEVGQGAGYKEVSVTNDGKTKIQFPASMKDNPDYKDVYIEAKVKFVNDWDNESNTGYGVDNKFVYSTSGWAYKKPETAGVNE